MAEYLSSKRRKAEFVILAQKTWVQIHHFQNDKKIEMWSLNKSSSIKRINGNTGGGRV